MSEVSLERDGRTDLPLVRMRPGETKMLGVDVSGRMRTGATISAVSSVTATSLGRVSGSSALTVASAAASGQEIEFLTSGGTVGETYRLRVTWTVGTETLISDIAVAVG